ncbi:MAG: dCMP deaminase [Parcubacteria group bacterium LiPW_15]|nr:MAG: dCMP deaminase [Parcubacteria group bacterium LiPW_15]
MSEYSVVSYIPAIHRGYLDFFKKYPGTLYVLGPDFVLETPRMERDIRALTPLEIKDAVGGLNIFSKIIILDRATLPGLLADPNPIIAPDEDVNRQFFETYLPDKKITLVPVFLRWDKQISTKEFEVPPDRIISESDFDTEMIGSAFKEATKSPDWWRQIGGVIVKDGKPILFGHNRPLPSEYTLNAFGDPRSNFDAGINIELSKFIHAEAGLIAEAAKKGIALEGSSIYTSTFPCPACAKSIAAAGIKKVYYSKGYSLLDAEDILKSVGAEIILVKF